MNNRYASRFAKHLRLPDIVGVWTEPPRLPDTTAPTKRALPAMTSLSKRALLTLPLLFLSGCLSLGGDATTTVYSPQIAVTPAAEWPSVTWPLVVAKPVASDALDSPRIAVRPEPDRLQVYQGAVWSESAPDLLQTTLVHGFEDSGKIVSVGRQASGVRSDFALLIDMRQFEAVYVDRNQPPAATIVLNAKLLGNPGGRVLAARNFRAEVPAADAKLPAVTAAFDQALTQVSTDIIGWTLTTGQANAQSVGPAR